MRILVHHGKHGDQYWMADTKERLNAAMRELFEQLDEYRCYEDAEVENPTELALARNGDAACIRMFLEANQGYEYEDWDLEEAIDPCTG